MADSIYFDSLKELYGWFEHDADKNNPLDLFRCSTEVLEAYDVGSADSLGPAARPSLPRANRALSAPTSPRMRANSGPKNNSTLSVGSRAKYLLQKCFPPNRYELSNVPPPEPSIDIFHRPNLLVCHDYKGGYLQGQDKRSTGYYSHGTGCRYFIQYPQLLDSFVYFTHHRVSVPPVGWINFCHRNGIKCLGTILFEGLNPAELDTLVTRAENGVDFVYLDPLCTLVQRYGFDGYLLNVESRFSNAHIASALVPFVEALKARLHQLSPKNTLVWYDSFTYPYNRVFYLNGVRDANSNFYNAADTFMSNYWWTVQNLQENLKNVGILGVKNKVYVGYDVWGRGSNIGKGGFDTGMACQLISKYQSNVALFAPAWTYEQLGSRNFAYNDTRFWIGSFQEELSVMSSVRAHNVPVFKVNDSSFTFYTNFSQGQGKVFSCKGVLVCNSPWVDSNLQLYLPLTIHRKKTLGLQMFLDESESFHAGSSIEIRYVPYLEEQSSSGCRIFSDQQVRRLALFDFNRICHFNTIGVKVSYKLNDKPEELFKLQIKYHIVYRNMRTGDLVVARKGYLVIPLGPTYGKWFTLDNAFNIDTAASESIMLVSAEVSYDEDNIEVSDTDAYRSYVMEDSVVTSVIDDEQYEKLSNSIYDNDEQEGWVVVERIKPKPASSAMSDSIAVDTARLKIGELSVINSNDYPAKNLFGVTPIDEIDRTLTNNKGALYSWKKTHDDSILYYVIYINDEFKGTSQIGQFFAYDDEKLEDSEGELQLTKVRVDAVDRVGSVYQGSDVYI